jgi:hypothetical protein
MRRKKEVLPLWVKARLLVSDSGTLICLEIMGKHQTDVHRKLR